MTPENRIRSAHHLLRSLILALLAFYITHLAKTGALEIYVSPGTIVGVKLSALVLYGVSLYELYSVLELRRGNTIELNCDCGGHEPEKNGPLQWLVYGLFLLPLALSLLPDIQIDSSLPANDLFHLDS